MNLARLLLFGCIVHQFTSPSATVSNGFMVSSSLPTRKHAFLYYLDGTLYHHRWINSRFIPYSAKGLKVSSGDDIENGSVGPPMSTTSNDDEGLSIDDNAALTKLLSVMENNAQEDVLPVPAFTALLILFGSLYVTFYGIYFGLNGFPETDFPLPRIF
jgi:hypothetical protein